jgi:ubiquinone/menaquinone biosynthesis C-methylase UbiE
MGEGFDVSVQTKAMKPVRGPNGLLEREIGLKFEEIADNGWFTDNLPADSPQFAKVKEITAPQAGKRILDAGCARGRFIKQLEADRATLFGIDLTETFGKAARKNVPAAAFARASVTTLPFSSNVFDAAYCVEVMEHIPDIDLALSELCRVLKPGGVLLVIDKSLQGLDPGTGLPNCLTKPWAERRGKWMYPADFPFRERWFWPRRLAGQMRKYYRSVRISYIPDGRGKASRLYRVLPFLSLDVAWIGVKPS